VNSLPKTVTRQRRDCNLNPGPSAPESSTLTTRLPSHPIDNLPHLKYVTAVPCNLSLITTLVGDCRSFSDINVSQGSVATHMRCGEIFTKYFVANLLENLAAKFFCKSVDN